MFKTTYYRKLLIVLVFVVLGFSFVLSAFVMVRNSQARKSAHENDQKTLVTLLAGEWDRLLPTLQQNAYELTQDPLVQRLSQAPEDPYWDYWQLNRALEDRRRLLPSYLVEFAVVFPAVGMVVSDNGTYSTITFQERYRIARFGTAVEPSGSRQGDMALSVDTVPEQSKASILFTVRQRFGDGEDVFFLFFVDAREQQLSGGRPELFMLRFGNSFIPVVSAETHQAYRLLDRSPGITNYPWITVFSKRHHQVSYVFLDNERTGAPLSELIASGAIVFFVTFLGGTVMSVFLSRSLYRPIKDLISFLAPEKPAGAVQGYDIDYIRQRIGEYRSAASALHSEMSRFQTTVTRNLLVDVTLGVVGIDDATDMASGINLDDFLTGSFRLVTLRGFIGDGDDRSQKAGEALQSRRFVRAFERSLGVRAAAHFLDGNSLVCILRGIAFPDFHDALIDVVKTMERENRTRIIAVVHPDVLSTKELNSAFIKSREILDRQPIAARTSLIIEGEAVTRSEASVYYPLSTETVVIELVRKGQTKEALSVLDTIIRDNLDRRNLPPAKLRQFVSSLLTTAQRIQPQAAKSISTSMLMDHVDHMALAADAPETLRVKILELFSRIVERKELAPTDEGEQLGRRMETYIQENYRLDISLTLLADEFGLSESYISRFFHDYSGSRFKTYLNRYRINKAKELLSSGQLKVREVATEVGYQSSDTFIKIFRKYEGLSPGKFEDVVKETGVDAR